MICFSSDPVSMDPSYAAIMTSNSPACLLNQACWSSKSNDFFEYLRRIFVLSSCQRSVCASVKVRVFSKLSEKEG